MPLVPPPIAALVRLQLLTGARPTELLLLRGCDLDTTVDVWVLRPERHKTQHHGHVREIYFGPQAQAELRPWLTGNPDAFLFSPAAAAEAERNQRKKTARKTPRWPSHCKRQPAATRKRPPRDHYDVAGYRRAIHRAADVADEIARKDQPGEQRIIGRWSPNRLRHNAATLLRKNHGLEVSRIILGHQTAFTTEIYAEVDRAKAVHFTVRASRECEDKERAYSQRIGGETGGGRPVSQRSGGGSGRVQRTHTRKHSPDQ